MAYGKDVLSPLAADIISGCEQGTGKHVLGCLSLWANLDRPQRPRGGLQGTEMPVRVSLPSWNQEKLWSANPNTLDCEK